MGSYHHQSRDAGGNGLRVDHGWPRNHPDLVIVAVNFKFKRSKGDD